MNTTTNRQRFALSALLLAGIGSLYMLTYSARMVSGDTMYMFNATASLVRYGDFYLDLTAGLRPFWEYSLPLTDTPLLPVDAEPLQIILAAPLYWLAEQIPFLGRVHAVWLFNVIAALWAVIAFFHFALLLEYRPRTAFAGAALLGIGTILWAYSKTFFQEPLTLLLLLLTAYYLEAWRRAGYRSWWRLLAWVGCFALALAARRASLLALPLITIIAFPQLESLFRPRWRRKAFLIAVVLIGGVLYYNTIPQSAEDLSRFYRQVEHIPWHERILRASMNQGVQGYLFAFGGSIWGTSPVLLLAIPGIVRLVRRNQMRYPLAALTVLLTYALGYAYGSNVHWFGGLSWPPRFLVPVVPLVMLCTLPVLDQLLDMPSSAKPNNILKGFTGLLIAYSIWIQFNAVSYWWGEYPNLLPPEAQGYLEWSQGLHNFKFMRWTILPTLWGKKAFDFWWVRNGTFLAPSLLFVTLAIASGATFWGLRKKQTANILSLSVLAVGTFAAGAFFTLWGVRNDPLYLGFSEGLHAAAGQIEQQLTADDIVIISQPGYERFFLNYGRLNGTRLITLQPHPGEQTSPEQPAQIESSHPGDLLARPTIQLVDTLARTHDRLWLLADSTPFVTWSVRPVERFMALYYYPLAATELTGADGLPVRLISYSTAAHHNPYALIGAEYAADLQFGDGIQLVGYNLPLGRTYAAGDALPISLQWQTDEALENSYSVALHLGQPGVGVGASAQDSPPYAGFAPTHEWEPYAPVWDNRAIQLPEGLADGEYQLWLGVYGLGDGGSVESLGVQGENTIENGTLGVLPTGIQIDNTATD